MAKRRRPPKIEFSQPGGALVEAGLDALRPGWRERAEANRSWWKPIEVMLVIGLWLAMWFWSWRYGLWFVHTSFHQSGSFQAFYHGGHAVYFGFAAFVVTVPLFCLAAIIVNSLVGLVPLLRRVSERGSDKFPELSLQRSNRDLASFGVKVSAIAVPVALLAAAL